MASKTSFTRMTDKERKLYTSDASDYIKGKINTADTEERSGRAADLWGKNKRSISYGEKSAPRYKAADAALGDLRKLAGPAADRKYPRSMADTTVALGDRLPMQFDGQPLPKRGMKVVKKAKGGSTASKRADGCATKGKTKGRFV